MFLAQGHNQVTPVKLEPATPRSRVKHSTTEPRCSLDLYPPSELLYNKTCVKQPLSKRPKIGFQVQLLLNVGQKYCRMLQGEHSAILLTFIKLPFVIKIFVLSIFEWLLYTDFSVLGVILSSCSQNNIIEPRHQISNNVAF